MCCYNVDPSIDLWGKDEFGWAAPTLRSWWASTAFDGPYGSIQFISKANQCVQLIKSRPFLARRYPHLLNSSEHEVYFTQKLRIQFGSLYSSILSNKCLTSVGQYLKKNRDYSWLHPPMLLVVEVKKW